MQKNIKTVTEYLIKQQRNILKGAIVLTGLILVYVILSSPTSKVKNPLDLNDGIVVDDSVNETLLIENNDEISLSSIKLDDIINDNQIEIPEIVVDEMVPSEIKVDVTGDKAMGIVDSFFNSYNGKNFKTACGFLSLKKCDPESAYAVDRLSTEYEKMVNGYEDVNVWLAENTEDFHSDVVCVKYSYKYKGDVRNKRISERMSFYVGEDTDGKKKITNRVCEKKFADTVGEVPCPILAKRDFCLEE